MADARCQHVPALVRTSGFAVVLLVAACGGSPLVAAASPSPSQSPRIASDAPPPATGSPEPTSSAATYQDPVFRVGDDERRVRVFVPDPAPSRPLPLLVFLHAAGESPATAIHDTRFDQLAAGGAAIVAFPPAAGRAWEAQVTRGLSDSDADEVFLTGLIEQLIDRYPVDPKQVDVAGFSMGAVMAGRLACRLADRITAVVIASGTSWIGACQPSRPVSVLIVHGTADSTFRYDAAVQMAQAWRTRDRCPAPADPEPIGGGATITTTLGCAGGSAVSLVSVSNGRHIWFTDPDATKLAWEFLTGGPGQ